MLKDYFQSLSVEDTESLAALYSSDPEAAIVAVLDDICDSCSVTRQEVIQWLDYIIANTAIDEK